jgi:hypothetical protein
MGYSVNISEHVCPTLSWAILTSDPQQVIVRSQVPPYTLDDPTLRAALTDEECSHLSTPVVQSCTSALEVDPDAIADISPPDAAVSPQVQTATYGSEFIAARTCVEQIIDLRNTLRYLGVPVREKAYMFGDNESVVNSATMVHVKLHKRHTMLSFHRVREAIASGMVAFLHIPGEMNPADILSKHWGYSQIWDRLKAILFWTGDTAELKN